MAYTGYDRKHTYVSEILYIIRNDIFHAVLHNKFLCLYQIMPLTFLLLIKPFILGQENVLLIFAFKRTVLMAGTISFLELLHFGVDEFVVHGRGW